MAVTSLVSVLARPGRSTDLFPPLHQRALEMTGGVCSLLFRLNPRNGLLHPTSASGLDVLGSEPWTPDADEATLLNTAFETGAPVQVADADRLMPDLAARLDAPAALLVPLVRGDERMGLLAIGFAAGTPARSGDDIQSVADAFLVSLELLQLRQRDELQRDLGSVLEDVSTELSASLNLTAGLRIFCESAKRMFGAESTSVWIHDRRARHLALHASSDRDDAARDVRVDTEDTVAPAAAALRRSRSEIVATDDGGSTATVAIPLRGRRRALGAIVLERARIEPGGELDVLDRADELGRQLAVAVENMQLLDDVIRSRRELENTFDSISHLVVVVDRTGRIVHVNKAFAARLGRNREDLVDQPIAESVGPELARWLSSEQSRNGGASSEGSASYEVIDPLLNGPFLVTATELLDHDRKLVGSVIVARDLQTQTKLEGEREELRRRLTQTEKLAALGQFVAGIAHELNNPLQAVLGHMELLRATGAFPKQLRREVQTIYREADRAAKIVRNLLVFAGSRRLTRRRVSLNSLLQKVFALRSAAHRAADIEVVRHYDEQLPRVTSDPLLLHQVFLNMVLNAEHAILATGRAGRIEVKTLLSPAGDRVIVQLRDTGTGIPGDTLSRIFEPFYTTKEVGKGTGLGLAIAYGIVQEHGGHITAANHPGGGAIFTVELPNARTAGR